MTGREARDDEREALARYPEDHKTIGGNAAQRRAFLAGVEYARKHPEPEIAEADVNRAARAMHSDYVARYPEEPPVYHAGAGQPVWRHLARAALDALRVPVGEGEQ